MSKLCIGFIYNELEWLPKKVKYCKDNGLDLYIIDNYSTDGSYGWLKANGIKCHRFDTQGAFDLGKLQRELIYTVAKLNPKWVVYLDADLFIYCDKPLNEVIDECDGNVLEFPRINFFETKEERFRYYKYINDVQVIFKHHTSAGYCADELLYFNKKVCTPNGVMINYGGTKEHRLEELKRREVAWNNGVHKAIGWHLAEYAQNGWLFKKEDLEDIEGSKYYSLYKRG